MHKKKLQLRSETIVKLSTDRLARVQGGVCYNSVANTDACTPECNETASCVPYSAGYCVKGGGGSY